MNFNLLSLYLKFLNFSENSLILETKAMDKKIVSPNCTCGIRMIEATILSAWKVEINGSETNTKQLAGVGKPIKFSFCRSSILNLASLKAENIGMARATNE